MLFFQGSLIKGAIFDIDGTVVDSLSLYHVHFNNGLELAGFAPVPKEFLFDCLAKGISLKGILRKALPHNVSDRVVEEIAEAILEGFIKVDMDIPLLPGVRDAFSFLKEHGIKIGLASGRKSGQSYELKRLRHLDLDHYVDVIVTASEAERRKPAADVIILCAERLGVDPGNCLVIGDSISDVVAARGSGAFVVAVCTGVDSADRLKGARPDRVISDLTTLPEILEIH